MPSTLLVVRVCVWGGASAPQPTTLQTLLLLLMKPPQCGHNPGIAPHERRFHSRPKVLPPTPRAVPDVPLDALNVPERARAALPRAVYRLTRIPSQAKLLVYRWNHTVPLGPKASHAEGRVRRAHP